MEKWRQTDEKIKIEIKQTMQMLNVCNALKNVQIDCDKKQSEEIPINKENLIVIPATDKKSIDKIDKMPNIKHFGGKQPFQKDQPIDDIFEDIRKANNVINQLENDLPKGKINKNLNNRYNDKETGPQNQDKKIQNRNINSNEDKSKEIPENFIVYKKPVNNISNNDLEKEKKDPMIWDPPEEKPGNKSTHLKFTTT